VAVCSVTYNRRALMVRVLAQLRELDYPAERIDVFLVDNASEDDTVERIATDFPEVSLIRSDVNLGVSAGFNAAIRAALAAGRDYDYIWLLDSDAEIEPETLAPLVRAMEEDPRIGVIGSAVYDPAARDRLVTLGLRVDWSSAAVDFCRPGGPEATGLIDVELIPACSSLTRAGLCRKLGPWDERFWLYWGDTDWCARVLREGFRVCCQPQSRAWHRDWSHTRMDFGSPFMIHDDVRGGLLFNLRHSPGHSLAGVRRLMLKSALKGALESLTARPGFGTAQERAVEDFLSGRFDEGGPSAWSESAKPQPVDVVCAGLRDRLPEQPRILLNRIDPARAAAIRAAFAAVFPRARFSELEPLGRSLRANLSTDVRGYLSDEVPQLALRLLGIFARYDVIVSDIAAAHLYNLVAAGRTLFVNASGQATLRENHLVAGFRDGTAALLRGFKRVYFDLPHAVRNCAPLISAAEIDSPGHPVERGSW
jgi:GT2 family glycosyltransferase